MGYLDFYRLSNQEKKEIFDQVEYGTGLPSHAVEKDWWVVRVLDMIFQTEIKEHTVFKGGTSLSKAWGLIDRFSEDIDLALDRTFLGFTEDIIKRKQVTMLRKASKKYIVGSLVLQLNESFESVGINDIVIKVLETEESDQDPLIIELNYPNVTETTDYVLPRVLVEIGCRSLREPFTIRDFHSLITNEFADSPFADEIISIPSVNPERTFLEKLFLLHEEFQRPEEKIRVDRLSRHLYDIHQISLSNYADLAIQDSELYSSIVEHRAIFSKVGGVDYTSHYPPNLNPIPPDHLLDTWKKDYAVMQEQMIYGESLPFEELIESIKKISVKINN